MVIEADAAFCHLFRLPSPASVQGRCFSSLFGPATDMNHFQTLLAPLPFSFSSLCCAVEPLRRHGHCLELPRDLSCPATTALLADSDPSLSI